MNSTCPTTEELRKFLRGELTAAEIGRIGDHAENCEICETRIQVLEREQDELLNEIRSAKRPTEEPSAALLEVRARLLKFASASPLQMAGESARFVQRPFGPFDLLQMIGQGGMGQVYLARHRKLHRQVAVKVIRPEFVASGDDKFKSRFEQEIRAAGQLQHPRLVIAHDAGEIEGCLYLSMEYVEGSDLGALVRERGPLPLEEAVGYIVQAAEGVQSAHEAGIIHRDLKPSNIMVTPQGDVKVLDLGLARLQTHGDQEMTQTGQVVGTFQYMAPEQFDDAHSVDSRADVYGLAATLYKLLTGHPPVGSKLNNPLKLVRAISSEIPNRLDSIRPDVPKALGDLVARSLAKEPQGRPRSAAEFAAALIAASGGISEPVIPVPAPPKSHRWVGLLLVAGLLAAGFWALIPLLTMERPDAAQQPEKIRQDTLVKTPPLSPTSGKKQEGSPITSANPPTARSPLDSLDPAAIPVTKRQPWHPKELVAVLGDENRKHWGPIRNISFSPDGKYVASVSSQLWGDGVMIHTTADLKLVTRLPIGHWMHLPPEGDADSVHIISYRPDGLLLTMQQDGKGKLWSLRDGQAHLDASFKIEGPIIDDQDSLSPGGEWIVTKSFMDGKLWLLDLRTLPPKVVAKLDPPSDSNLDLALSADGKTLCALDNNITSKDLGKIKVWDMTTIPPRETSSFSLVAEKDRGKQAHVTVIRMDISPDGKTLAYQLPWDSHLRFWDLPQGKALTDKAIERHPGWLRFSPKGGSLVYTDLISRTLRQVPNLPGKPIDSEIIGRQFVCSSYDHSPAFSRDGEYLAAANQFYSSSLLRLWHRTSQKVVTEIAPPDFSEPNIVGVTFSSDSRKVGILTQADQGDYEHEVRFQSWLSGETPQLLFTERDSGPIHFNWGSLSPRCQFDAFNKAGALTQFRTRFPENANDMPPGDECVTLRRPLNDAVAAGYRDGKIVILSAPVKESEKPEEMEWNAHTGSVERVVYSPTGKQLASFGTEDLTLRLWETDQTPPRLLREIKLLPAEYNKRGGVRFRMAFSADGTRLVFASNGVWDWDLAQLQPRKLGITQFPVVDTNLAYSPDNKQLLIGGLLRNPHNVVLWNLVHDRLDRGWILPGSTFDVAFAPDGRHIAWVNTNGSAYILRLAGQ